MKKDNYSDDIDLEIDEIVDKYYDAIHTTIFFLCNHSKIIAEDITQNVFMFLIQSWDKLDKSKTGAWLFEVARRKIYEYLRTENSQRGGKNVISSTAFDNLDIILQPTYDQYFNPNDATIERIKNEILDSLSYDERKLYGDFFVNGKSYEEIVELYSMPYSTLTTKMSRLKHKVDKAIKQKSFDLGLYGMLYIPFAIYLTMALYTKR